MSSLCAVKLETCIVWIHVVQALAVERNLGPWGHLCIAVFTHHICLDRVRVNACLLGEPVVQTGRVEAGTCAKYVVLRETGFFSNQVGNDIAWVGYIDEEPFESAGHNLWNIFIDLYSGEVHFIVAASGSYQGYVACAVDDNVAVTQFFISSRLIHYAARHEKNRIHQILYFALNLLFIYIAEADFIGNAHHTQIKCYVGTYMSNTNYADNSFLHIENLLYLSS